MAKDPFPLDRGWAWAIVVGCFVCVFFMVGTAKSIGIFLTEFEDYFNVPTYLASMVMGGSAIVYAFLAPVCIVLGQTFCARRVILIGGMIGFVGMSVSCLLFNIEYVIVTFGVCFGIGNATLYGNCLVTLGQYFKERRSLANGLALTGASIGQFVMAPFIQYLLDTYGLQGCLLLVGGVYFHVVAAGALLRPISFWASTEESGIPLQERGKSEESAIALNESGKSEEAVGQVEKKENGHLSPCVDDETPLQEESADDTMLNAASIDEKSQLESTVASDGTTPRSHLISKEVNARVSELSGRKSRPHMTSNSSLCTSPLYGSFVFDPHDFSFDKTDEEEMKVDEKNLLKFWKKLVNMFDFSVMKSYVAMFISFSSFLSFFGYFNFVLFLPATVLSRGIDHYEKAMVVSVCGIGDLVGRLVSAVIGDRNFIPRYKLQAVGMILVGINIGGFIFADSLGWMLAHSALYGFSGGVYVSLAAVVIIDFVGLKHMPRLLAVNMLIQGVGASLGQPLLGSLKGATGSYDIVVLICTFCTITGGLVLLAYPLVLKLEFRRPEQFRLLPEGFQQAEHV